MDKGPYTLSCNKLGSAGFEGVDEEEKEKPYVGKIKPNKYYVVMKGEKLRSLIIGSIKAEKLKSMLAAQSRAARLKLWAVRVVAVVLIWAVAVQLRLLGEAVGSSVLKFRSSYSFPPPSELFP